MSVEKLSPQETIYGIVDRQIIDYSNRFEKMWPGYAEAFAVLRLGFYMNILISTYETGDASGFFKLEGDRVFQEFQEGFYRDVASVVGVPFPSAPVESKLEVARAAKDGLIDWISQKRVEAHAST